MRYGLLGLALASMLSGASLAAERSEFVNLRAPAPAPISPVPSTDAAKPIAFARALVRLPTTPWARVGVATETDVSRDYVTWDAGRGQLDQAALRTIFIEELRAANVRAEGEETLFGDASAGDLQLGAVITDMKANICKGCGLLTPWSNWVGVATMTVHWEIHSRLQDRVIASIDTQGGFTAPDRGMVGEPLRFVHEAFRDNLRRLVATQAFRSALTAPSAAPPTSFTTIAFTAAPLAKRTVSASSESVVAVFAGDGHGTGFLISADGYVLTNHHVVGGAKYVKVRWPDRTEVLGEVVRSDRRRDVALIKIDAADRKSLALRSGAPTLGESVFAIGTPLDAKLQGTVTKGIVSANRTYDGQTFIQSDVAINGGNSGGPLLDESGAVLGIAVSGYRIGDAPTGLNLFIPIGAALDALALKPAS